MATDLYDLTVPVFIRNFANLSAILAKGEAFAGEKGIAPETLLNARLIEDMAPLTRQVQIASDTAKLCAARLAAIDAPVMPDEEASFAELQARIDQTTAFLKSVPRDAVTGKEAAPITLTFPNGSMDFVGIDYVLGFALPNFFFHVTTAYALLRAKGVQIGKRDFLGG
ncbi:MAG: DUF1993 domain-containing protein [Sphingomonas sp.]